MSPTLRDRLGLLALLAAPLLLPFAIGRIEPIPNLFDMPVQTARIAAVQDDASFRVEGLARENGLPVHAAGSFSQLTGAPLERTLRQALHARGHLNAEPGRHAWAFMQGREGEVYMQFPPLLVEGDEWVASNLRVGLQVARVLFVDVDAATHATLLDKGAREDWSALPRLPAGARVRARIELEAGAL